VSDIPSKPKPVLDFFQDIDGPQPANAREARMRVLMAEHGSPLLVLDAARLRAQYRALSAALPGVELFYAVKALPAEEAIRILAREGAGLDLASSGEIELARASRVSPRRTVHTHPIKTDSEIRAALRFGTTTFVVDNPLELDKFQRYRHRVGLLLRVRFQSPDAVVDLSRKFGCTPAEVIPLLRRARSLGLHVKGLSFHVGSQSQRPDTHVRAIKTSLELMHAARCAGLGRMNLLDIGGGFPVDYMQRATTIDVFCAPIRAALATAPPWLRLIAEPGRYLVAPAVTALSTVIGKATRDARPWYYLDDGVYGSWSGQLFDHARYPVEVFRRGEYRPSVLAGPTCDSIDVIDEDLLLPELEIGDLVVGHQMGAYTAATSTDFNGLRRARLVTVNDSVHAPAHMRAIA
jgi:ornithine decarboxylase